MMKKILITGGAGFVGSNLAEHLAKKGYRVVIYDNLSRLGSELTLKSLHDKYPSIEAHRGELDDIADYLHDHKVDLVYHLAAQVAVTHSYKSPRSDFRINAHGTFNVVHSTKTPVIYASTNKVYGDNVNHVPIDEHDTRYDFAGEYKEKGLPEDFSIDTHYHTPYGISKLVGELYTREMGGVANRFSCMYGPNQFGNEDQGWVAHFVISKIKNKPLMIYGDGKQVRDLLFVDDVVRLLEIQGENIDKIRGQVFNIGGGFKNTLSLLELCKLLKVHPSFGDWRPADQKVYYSDISKIKKLLGWEPTISPEEGIDRLTEWVQNHHP